ncbi:glycoside hydrolase family 28 protein [Pollutibacter soli]|uniref:glycoside hydrolase family 28 protein n=1 Tax=Pollutibacter soli TaxID=3034157 RepID=UPI0030131FF3
MKILLLAIALFFSHFAISKNYFIKDFGALGDGITLNSQIIQGAIDFVAARGGGRLIFQPGSYLTGSIYLKSNVIIQLDSGAVLMGSNNPFDYVKDAYIGWMSMIFALKQDNVGIVGKGTVDGRGAATANNMTAFIHNKIYNDRLFLDRPSEFNRPQNLYFRECKNVTVTGITLKNPASWNQTYDQCENVYVDSIRVDSKNYWNNDGIDIVDSRDVIIKNSFFDAADDVICFKSQEPNKMCENVVVENCVGRSSANGLKFGTGSRGGFRNFKVKNLVFYDTYRSAITFAAVDGAIVENIVVDGVKATNVGNAIYLRVGDRNSRGKKSTMRDVTIRNLHAEIPAGKPDAGYPLEGPIENLPRNISPAGIAGLPNLKITNVVLENITIVYPGGSNPNYARRGTTAAELDSIPEMPAAYPEFSQFRELPSWGIYLRHVDSLKLINIKLIANATEYRPAIVAHDVHNLQIYKLEIIEPDAKKKKQVVLHRSLIAKIK